MLNTVKYVSSLGLRVHNNLNDFMYIFEIISYLSFRKYIIITSWYPLQYICMFPNT